MLKLDYSVFIQIANFLILIFILNIVLYRPIRRILGQRKDEMNTLQGATGDYQSKAARYAEQLEENMAGARREGYKEKEEKRAEGLDLEKTIEEIERKIMKEALVRTHGVKVKAAELLGLSFRSFRYRLSKLGIDLGDDDAEAAVEKEAEK